jgi:EAL domain-containing protein (putative c-di-GMP-specific phosphodiesterase class I)
MAKVNQALGGVDKKNKFIELLKENTEKVVELSQKVHDEFVNDIETRNKNKATRYAINDSENAIPFRI